MTVRNRGGGGVGRSTFPAGGKWMILHAAWDVISNWVSQIDMEYILHLSTLRFTKNLHPSIPPLDELQS